MGLRNTLIKAALLGLSGFAGCGGPTGPAVTMTRVGPEAPATAPAVRKEAGSARAIVAQGPSDLLTGPAAAGEAGDLVLKNDKLVAVIRAAAHRGRVAPSGGNLVDLAPVGGRDALGEAALFLDPEARAMPVFREVTVAQDGRDGGLAIVRAAGHDARDEQVLVDVDYVLESGADRVRVITTVTHKGRSHYRDFLIGHWMSWGTLQPFAPGPGDALEGQRTRSSWIGADASDGAVLLAGVAGLLEAFHGRDFSQVIEHRAYLAPGAILSWETSLFVASKGGVAAAESMLNQARQTVTGQIQGTLREKRRQKAVADGWVLVGATDGTWSTRARVDADGAFVLDLEPGNYRLVAVAAGRAPAAPIAVRVGPDEVVQKPLVLEPPGRLKLQVVDAAGQPLPARAALVGRRGTPTPTLGPSNAMPLAGNFIHLPTGTFSGRILPGEYDLTVGAGPRFAQQTQAVTVRPGETAKLNVTLARQVEAAGFLAVDPHVHTVHGPTSGVTAAARLASCRVEGIDVLVATDERAGEPWPAPTPESPLVALRGLELQTADARLGALPLVSVPSLPARLPETSAAAMPFLHGLPGTPPVAVFRPRGKALGYFETFRFDSGDKNLPRGGFTLQFDLLEVLSPGLGADTDRTMEDFLNLAAAGHDLVPLAGSGADDLATQICGAPRTWVRAAVRDAATLEAALRRSPVVVSGGPLLHVATVERPEGVKLVVRVEAPAWARPATLEVHTGAPAAVRLELPAGNGPLNETREIDLPAQATFAVVRVDGPRRPNPLYPGGVRPLAVTGTLRFAR